MFCVCGECLPSDSDSGSPPHISCSLPASFPPPASGVHERLGRGLFCHLQAHVTGPWLSPDMSNQPGRKDFLLQEGQAPLQEPCLLPRVNPSHPLLPHPAQLPGSAASLRVIAPDSWVGLAKVIPTPTLGPSLGFEALPYPLLLLLPPPPSHTGAGCTGSCSPPVPQ